MRKPKKFKRYDEGGAVGAGSGDPFSYTDFSNRERNLRKPSEAAPIEERKPPKAEEAEKEDTKPVKAPPPSGRREIPPTPLTKDEKRGETDFNYPPQSGYNQALEDAKEQGRRARDAFKPANKPAADKPINISTGASGFKFPKEDTSYKDLENARANRTKPAAPAKTKSASPDDIPGTDVKTPYKGETIDNSNLAAKQFAQSTLGATAAGRTLGAGVRGAMGLGRMFESAAKPTPKTEPKLESKPEPKQGELFDAKGNPTAEATRVSPKREPKQGKLFDEEGNVTAEAARSGPKPAPKEAPKAEPKAETKSGAIQPTGKGPSEAGKNLMEKGRGSLKDQAMEAVNKQRAATKDPRGAVRPEPKTIKPTGKGSSEAGKKLMDRANNRSSTILEKERKPDLAMQEYISGRESARTRARDLPDDGLSTTRYANKKGGKIPAFKKGGLVSRGDGCAMRGKTKGRMV